MTLDLAHFDAAIVDLDGTLVDTLGDFTAALNAMLADLGLPTVDAHVVETMVGKGSEHLVRSVLHHLEAPDALYDRVAADIATAVATVLHAVGTPSRSFG